jgi:RecB family exonuclease
MATLRPDPKLTLPAGFQFTQSKLQDFVDCPRRFYLLYILNQQWPSPLAEPQAEVEQALRRGARFHQMVERHQSGIPLETLGVAAGDDETLSRWLVRYEQILGELGAFERAWPEISLSTVIAGYPVVAKYDLIALRGQTLLALDWKTGRLPAVAVLEQRMQTVVYLLVLSREAARLAGRPVQSVTLEYVQIPGGERRKFEAAPDRLRRDENRLRATIEAVVEAVHASDFPLTGDEHRCRFCRYRGLCGRGATTTLDLDATDELDLEDLWGVEPGEADPSVVEF